MKRAKRIVLVVALSIVGVVVTAGIANRPPPLDLRSLGALHPQRKSIDPGCCTIYDFRQSRDEVEAVLDRAMNQTNGWERGGARDLNYIWYHREGWRNQFQGLLGSIGMSGAFVYLQTKDGVSRVTVYPGPGELFLP